MALPARPGYFLGAWGACASPGHHYTPSPIFRTWGGDCVPVRPAALHLELWSFTHHFEELLQQGPSLSRLPGPLAFLLLGIRDLWGLCLNWSLSRGEYSGPETFIPRELPSSPRCPREPRHLNSFSFFSQRCQVLFILIKSPSPLTSSASTQRTPERTGLLQSLGYYLNKYPSRLFVLCLC